MAAPAPLPPAIFDHPGRLIVGGAPEGVDALLVAEAARRRGGAVLFVARDEARMTAFAETLAYVAPDVAIDRFPAWDCLPYDRVSPNPEVSSVRMATLARLAAAPGRNGDKTPPRVVAATVAALLQRAPARAAVAAAHFAARVGERLDLDALTAYLGVNGYVRVGAVTEPGEYAVRGGIVDIYPPGVDLPLRLDLFGDDLDGVRAFDPATQQTVERRTNITLAPISEAPLSPDAIRRFRAGYVAAFGPAQGDDPLYEAVSAGRRHQGMEHWAPLFHETMETLPDYLPDAPIFFDSLAEEAAEARFSQIADYHEARCATPDASVIDAPVYRALAPDALYLSRDDWATLLAARRTRLLTPFQAPESAGAVDAGGRQGRDFAGERAHDRARVFDALVEHVAALRKEGRTVAVASYSQGSRERLAAMMADHGLDDGRDAQSWAPVAKAADPRGGKRGPGGLFRLVLGLEHGFELGRLVVVTEQDVLGDRLVRAARRSRRADNFLTEAAALNAGDLVVHVDHGVGRYEGLKAIEVSGAPHDCLEVHYAEGAKLYLPVENIELLSRWGGSEEGAQLDRLGGGAWQARKARAKDRIREIAHELMRVAAERQLRPAERFHPPDGLYDEFVSRFPYQETEDQLAAIEDAITDLGAGKPMDRLVCGDVGFGKTEVALRAGFVAALSGKQVAVLAPTTLLARQHYKNFAERFAGWPVRVAQLSRLVPAKEQSATKKGLKDGSVDIVIGTHALLGKAVQFHNLGLMILDEEQHFGVKHKERLKEMRADVHVLTLTATPIPRTLQLAMSGVRELSIIATPPIDRLAVRTYVTPFDPVVVREALLREHYRGGQSFFVAPRISDLREAADFLKTHVPEVKVAVAHGQMAPGALDDIMNAFYDGKFDVLLSTTIVESGLDIPTANTMIIHRADMFGLAQLYQLRGRIGRSKTRAYAYITVSPRKTLTGAAEKRLKVLQSLDHLGAGFTLASHDLDIRGAGNLLGEEQSGHIKEVGFELYQEMLEEAVASLRSGDQEVRLDDQWSPQINIGAAVLIPERYVADLDVRMGLYRRLSELEDETALEGFAAELVDRFGPTPAEVEQLLKVVRLKQRCRRAGVAKLDVGPKGATLQFRDDRFANPAGLVVFINQQRGTAKLRPDHKLVYLRSWDDVAARIEGALTLAKSLATIAEADAA